MKLRKGYVTHHEVDNTYIKLSRCCIIHGFFQWADGDNDTGPLAVVEFEDGTVQEIPPTDVVFTEKLED